MRNHSAFHGPHNRPLHILGIPSSKNEIIDIIKAWLVVSFIFAILERRSALGANLLAAILTQGFLLEVTIAGITVGIGFLLHELAHKLIAQNYGCAAEFRSDDLMLGMALLMAAVAGFVFIAPGATLIAGRVRPDQSGKIALAGPLTNVGIAVVFACLAFTGIPLLQLIGARGYYINVFLAIFNLIPFFIFDGKKIWAWSKLVWAGMVVLCIAMMIPVFLSG